jgi:hypothetical protein
VGFPLSNRAGQGGFEPPTSGFGDQAFRQIDLEERVDAVPATCCLAGSRPVVRKLCRQRLKPGQTVLGAGTILFAERRRP